MSKVFTVTAYGGPEGQLLTEREAPAPAAGEIAIEVRAAGVNPADWKRREGHFGTAGTLPLAMGFEVAGVVTALGEGAGMFVLGDEVLGGPARGQGAFAEHTVLKAAAAVRKPASLSFVDAATLPVAGTAALDLIDQVELPAGATVMVLGASGGVGQMVLQLASLRGLRTIGIASAPRRALIEQSGALFVPSGPDAAEAVRALAPEGVDLLVDLVGGKALRALAPLAKDPSRLISAADADAAEELGGTGRVRSKGVLGRITEIVGQGRVTPPQVVATYPLERAAEAMEAVEHGRVGGKIVIVP